MHVAVFGSTGFLGSEIVSALNSANWAVSKISTSGTESINPKVSGWTSELKKNGRLDGIVWAQGSNAKDTVLTSTPESLSGILEANVLFVSRTLKELHEAGLLNNPCRGVVLGSIWQEISRPDKFSYSVSKAALLGLVNSIAIDMASKGFFLNSVLPGVVDSPMTRANLTESSIRNLTEQTPGGQLVSGQEIASVVSFLLSPISKGINGQSIVVDNGWSKARYV
jgi:NAD(P)-dependent dehydrogenase (short-subunit alcohol dehydrogenase family)